MINKKKQASIKELFEGRLTRYIYYLSVVNRPISNLKLEVQRGGTYLSSYPQTILPKPEWGTYLKMLRSSPTFFSSWLLSHTSWLCIQLLWVRIVLWKPQIWLEKMGEVLYSSIPSSSTTTTIDSHISGAVWTISLGV